MALTMVCLCVCVCACAYPVDGIPELLDFLCNSVCNLLQLLTLIPSLLLLPCDGLLVVPQHRADHLQQAGQRDTLHGRLTTAHTLTTPRQKQLIAGRFGRVGPCQLRTKQATKAYVAEMYCTQLLLLDWFCYVCTYMLIKIYSPAVTTCNEPLQYQKTVPLPQTHSTYVCTLTTPV